jgi:hypothetical protein
MGTETTRVPVLRQFPVGKMVRVKSLAEIRASLDPSLCLRELPFMSEMAKYCGREFLVSGWAHKTCVEGYGLRALGKTVFLEDLRCSGDSHDGCQRACLLFWQLEWLEPVGDAPVAQDQLKTNSPHSESPGWITKKGSRYFCQSTELLAATRSLPWWQGRQYLEDFASGQLRLFHILKGIHSLLRNKIRGRSGARTDAEFFGDRHRTPNEQLGLSPGDTVAVRTKDQIIATLDREGKNRGLEFAAEMTPLCGSTHRVQGKISRVILEQTGEMKEIRDTVTLAGAYCDGIDRRFCPRKNVFMWREIWLERKTESAKR